MSELSDDEIDRRFPHQVILDAACYSAHNFLLVLAIGITAFDGASSGPLFSDVAPHLQDFFGSLGANKGTALELAFCVGLSLAPRGHTLLRDRQWHFVFCFSNREDAEKIMTRFSGRWFAKPDVAPQRAEPPPFRHRTR